MVRRLGGRTNAHAGREEGTEWQVVRGGTNLAVRVVPIVTDPTAKNGADDEAAVGVVPTAIDTTARTTEGGQDGVAVSVGPLVRDPTAGHGATADLQQRCITTEYGSGNYVANFAVGSGTLLDTALNYTAESVSRTGLAHVHMFSCVIRHCQIARMENVMK